MSLQYVEIQFVGGANDGTQGYQESFQGLVQRYTDLSGNTLSGPSLPAGVGCTIIDPNPATPGWMPADPTLPPPPPPNIVISQLTFIELFTPTEQVTIYTAAQTNAQIQLFIDMLHMAPQQMVDLSDPLTILGINGLEAAGLIGTGRAAQILSGVAP